MLNRWFHRARLHLPEQGSERKVSWLELFYDLIYVAAIIQLGDALSHHVSTAGFLGFAALFVPIWLTWTAFTFYSNRFVIDDFGHRALVFIQMLGVAGMAVSVPGVFEGSIAPFVWSYVVVRLVLAALYYRADRHVEEARGLARRYWVGSLIGAVLWGASLTVLAPWTYLLWAAALGVELAVPLSARARELSARFPPDALHASERYGLLTIIVLGESFVKVLSAVADVGLTPATGLMAGLGLLITCALWWIYFDDVAGSRVKRRPLAAVTWVYTHLPLTIGLTASGVAIKKIALLDPLLPSPTGYRWLICGVLALVLLSVGALDAITERRQAELSDSTRVRIRLASAAFILLLAPAGALMPAWAFVVLVAAVMGAQVFLDLSFSPMFHDAAEAQHEERTMYERVGPVPAAPMPKRRPDVRDAVRKGAPTELRRDLYFHLMDASWAQLLVWVLGLYLFTNVLFGALYVLDPGGVGGAKSNSFLEAFSFSVQTLATIGYGVLHPDSPYSHSLVALEALVGLLGVALVTGLIFAKVSRPTSSVLFAKYPVVTLQNGLPTLMFRLGNARGNDIVDASMKVAVLKDTVSAEGQTMRRLFDLKLARDNQPLFSLSWTVMHPLDESSPLFGLTAENYEDFFVILVAIVTGHDGTYGQTIHARHIYVASDLRPGHRLVDVLSTLDDGRLLVDYTKFHDVVRDG